MRRQNERGLAMLESAMLSVLLLGIFTAGISFYDYLRIRLLIQESTEKHLSATSTKAFSLRQIGHTDLAIEPDTSTLSSMLDETVARIADELKMLGLTSNNTNTFDRGDPLIRIEGCFAVFDIDSKSGESYGIKRFECVTPLGSFSPENDESETRLDNVFMAHATGSESKRGGAGLSAIAIPFGIQDADYLGSSIITGVRIFVSLEGRASSFSSYLYSSVPYLRHTSAITLRGDLS